MKKILIVIGCLLLVIIGYYSYKYYKNNSSVIRIKYDKEKICDYKPHLYYEEEGRKVYSYCIDKIEIKDNDKFIDLKDYFNNHTLEDFDKLFKGGVSFDDGGTTIYRDGGTRKYLKGNTTVIICRKLNGNNDIYIGNKDMDYKHNFCTEDNSTTTYRFKVLEISKYNKDQYNEEGTSVIYSNSYKVLLENDYGKKETVILNNIRVVPVKNRRYDFEFIIPKELENIDLYNDINSLFKKAYIVEIRDVEDNYVPIKVLSKLNNTNKIVIKNNDKEIGTIKDIKDINKVLDIISSSSKIGNVFNCDGTNIELNFYYSNGDIIEKVKVWINNERILPMILGENGCSYYTVPKGKDNLKKIIEDNSDLKFYVIYDETKTCATALEKIYEDDKHEYSFNCIKSDSVFIKFLASDKKITLKEALNNKEIEIDRIMKDYPDLLIKKEK